MRQTAAFAVQQTATTARGGFAAKKAHVIWKRRKEVDLSLAKSFLRDVEGTAQQRVALFRKLKSSGVLDGVDAEQLRIAENTLLAAMQKEGGDE
jgi:uncharacterized protein YjhX (UPF0386 family)